MFFALAKEQIVSINDQKILIVDDEESLLFVLKDFFDDEGFHTTTASSGNQACLIYDKNDFDVILCDVRMPDGDGLDFLNYINQQNKKKPLFIFASAYSDLDPNKAKEFGANDFFYKPLDINLVLKRIHELL